MPQHRPVGWVDCQTHGRQRSYFICVHIEKAEDIKVYRPWTEEDGADLMCGIDGPDHSVDEVHLMCEAHVIEKGLLPSRSIN